jgi:hypothetical protein
MKARIFNAIDFPIYSVIMTVKEMFSDTLTCNYVNLKTMSCDYLMKHDTKHLNPKAKYCFDQILTCER